MAQKEVSFQVFRGSKESKIVKDTTTRLLGPNDAFVKVTHSGICGTDEHYLHAGCVLGHEGVGVVEDVGSQVKGLKKGDPVGFGYVHRVCGQCDYCLNGKPLLLEVSLMSTSLTNTEYRKGTVLPRSPSVRLCRS